MRRRDDHSLRLGLSRMIWVERIRNSCHLPVKKKRKKLSHNILVTRSLNWSQSLGKETVFIYLDRLNICHIKRT